MPELLFKLRNVPDDEAEEVRQLLNDHEINFYETRAGGWGISMPGIWLPDDRQFKGVGTHAAMVSGRNCFTQFSTEGISKGLLM